MRPVQTNRANALQVEIVCYSDKSKADAKPGRLWVGDLPDTAYGDLAEFVHWVHSEFLDKLTRGGEHRSSRSRDG